MIHSGSEDCFDQFSGKSNNWGSFCFDCCPIHGAKAGDICSSLISSSVSKEVSLVLVPSSSFSSLVALFKVILPSSWIMFETLCS